MRLIQYKGPRQSGKTTNLVGQFMLNPKESLFFTFNNIGKSCILNNFPQMIEYKNNIHAFNNLNSIRGVNYPKYIFIDDRDLIKDEDSFIRFSEPLFNKCEVLVTSECNSYLNFESLSDDITKITTI